jgi:hypothetical protein
MSLIGAEMENKLVTKMQEKQKGPVNGRLV